MRALAAIGYECQGKAGLRGRQFFRRGREVHPHVVSVEAHWQRWIVFGDYLRAHPDRASAYERVERQLVVRYTDNRNAYTEAKAETVRELEREASARHLEAKGFRPVEFAVDELRGSGPTGPFPAAGP